ncbi:MAG: hypothetical protein ACFB3T_03935 [Geminicoccaceae bacterium]
MPQGHIARKWAHGGSSQADLVWFADLLPSAIDLRGLRHGLGKPVVLDLSAMPDDAPRLLAAAGLSDAVVTSSPDVQAYLACALRARADAPRIVTLSAADSDEAPLNEHILRRLIAELGGKTPTVGATLAEAQRAWPAGMKRASAPRLCVIVDTEAAFDWDAPLERNRHETPPPNGLKAFHAVCERLEVRPAYVLDLAVIQDDRWATFLADAHRRGTCELGLHPHAWMTPPHDATRNLTATFQGNLPPSLEHAKLSHLRNAFVDRFGFTPRLHKAGRYGIGPATAAWLLEHGFQVDMSPSAGFNIGLEGGPDFSRLTSSPFWFEASRRLLCLPTTGGCLGKRAPFDRLPPGARRWPGFGSLLAAVRLSPEAGEVAMLLRLTHRLLTRGLRTFSLSLHSSSLSPGGNPYVHSEADVTRLLARIEGYVRAFQGPVGGELATPLTLYADYRYAPIGAANTQSLPSTAEPPTSTLSIKLP